jgi:hypothetical protein
MRQIETPGRCFTQEGGQVPSLNEMLIPQCIVFNFKDTPQGVYECDFLAAPITVDNRERGKCQICNNFCGSLAFLGDKLICFKFTHNYMRMYTSEIATVHALNDLFLIPRKLMYCSGILKKNEYEVSKQNLLLYNKLKGLQQFKKRMIKNDSIREDVNDVKQGIN